MESKNQPADHDSINSSGDEYDDQASRHHDTSSRCFECVFCKRGFTTAQALGGHMNIHRKDRAAPKTRPSAAAAAAACKQNYNQEDQHSTSTNYNNCKVDNIPTASTQHNHNHYHQLGLRLSLQFATSRFSSDDDQEMEIKTRGGLVGNDDLDLELRLGYNP